MVIHCFLSNGNHFILTVNLKIGRVIADMNQPNGIWYRLVQFGFRLLYNEMAWSYDLVSWSVSLGEWRVWQKQSLRYLSGTQVLEIAHGPGHMLIELRQAGVDVVGLDLSPAMGRQAQKRLKQHDLASAVPLLRCRLPDLPFGKETFDSILSQFPTNFIFEPETLNNLYTILRPGGRLVILPEGHLVGSGLLLRFIAWLFYITGQSDSPKPPDPDNPPVWHPFTSRIEAAGFRVEVITMRFKRSAATIVLCHKP